MTDTNTKPKISSWAVPSAADDATWERMTRDEQLEALRDHLNGLDCSTATDVTVAEVVEEARAALKAT
ncbi:MAG: hypothetical protein ACR2O4_00630 [Hyphomicrobiaceae bacterium]